MGSQGDGQIVDLDFLLINNLDVAHIHIRVFKLTPIGGLVLWLNLRNFVIATLNGQRFLFDTNRRVKIFQGLFELNEILIFLEFGRQVRGILPFRRVTGHFMEQVPVLPGAFERLPRLFLVVDGLFLGFITGPLRGLAAEKPEEDGQNPPTHSHGHDTRACQQQFLGIQGNLEGPEQFQPGGLEKVLALPTLILCHANSPSSQKRPRSSREAELIFRVGIIFDPTGFAISHRRNPLQLSAFPGKLNPSEFNWNRMVSWLPRPSHSSASAAPRTWWIRNACWASWPRTATRWFPKRMALTWSWSTPAASSSRPGRNRWRSSRKCSR